MRLRTALLASLLSVLLPIHARSQGAPTTAPWGLYSIRYDTRTSNFIYAGYGYGDTFGMVAVLHNPRSGYSEHLGGIGRRFTFANGPTQFAALAVAKATEGWYGQLYLLPTLHRGNTWVRATSESYVPLSSSGTPQFALSPIAATFAVNARFEAGVSTDWAIARDAGPTTAVGPQIRLAVPSATLSLDAQRVIGSKASRLRVSFLAAF
jgi:hypothetical protein